MIQGLCDRLIRALARLRDWAGGRVLARDSRQWAAHPAGAGGPSQPSGVQRAQAQMRPSSRARPKGTLLYLPAVPLLAAALWALGSGWLGAVLANGAAFALFIAAARLTRRGTGAAGEQRALALGRWLPAVPLRDLGGALTVLATAFTAYFSVGHGLAASLLFGAVAGAGFHLFYGFVPLRRRAPASPAETRAQRTTSLLEEAERRIRDIEQTSLAIGNAELKARLWRIALQARRILGQIAERPESMHRARRFLTTYLEGAQQVTRGYARSHVLAQDRAGELEQSFRNVLITIEEVFVEQERRLLESDLMDLDVQIEVLQKQLKHEGIL